MKNHSRHSPAPSQVRTACGLPVAFCLARLCNENSKTALTKNIETRKNFNNHMKTVPATAWHPPWVVLWKALGLPVAFRVARLGHENSQIVIH